ncbi:MAG: sulfatase, partial [Bacteroidota bacterium]
PHEPYFSSKRFQDLYPHCLDEHWDWPPYRRVNETPEAIQHMRCQSAALHSMCDHYLGRVLDLMDELDLWEDTMLIVNTDHGFMLGEHDWWGKVVMPFYDEIARTPLFIWDPRSRQQGVRRQSLVQSIDLAPTVLEYFGVDRTKDMEGVPLAQTVAEDTPVREAGMYGIFGGHVNVTDGRYTYMRWGDGGDNRPLNEYTLMPTHMKASFSPEELQDIQLQEPFEHTKGCRTMKIEGRSWGGTKEFRTELFDTKTDPDQLTPIENPEVEKKMIGHLDRLMRENDAPAEQWERLGLD